MARVVPDGLSGKALETEWLGKLRRLNPNVNRKLGNGADRFAPHKPLLLLCLIDLAEAGELKSGNLQKLPSLRLRFDSYWSIVQLRWQSRPNFDLPFYHLSTQGFWKPITKEKHPAKSPESTFAVELNPEFYNLLLNPMFRDLARTVLIETWFPAMEQAGLYAALGFTKKQVQKFASRLKEDAPLTLERIGRDARFRVTVVTQYRYTCALTGYGLQTGDGHLLIQAAHIHSFSKSQNDAPENGLALSRDAHWMFDEGLWTVDVKNKVHVSPQVFTEWGPEAYSLKRRHGQPLIFLEGVSLRPKPEHLAWHRAEVFKVN